MEMLTKGLLKEVQEVCIALLASSYPTTNSLRHDTVSEESEEKMRDVK